MDMLLDLVKPLKRLLQQKDVVVEVADITAVSVMIANLEQEVPVILEIHF